MSSVQNTIDLPLNEFIRIQKRLRCRELHLLGFDDGGEMMACVELMWASQWYQHHAKKAGALKNALTDLMPILRDWEPDHSTGEERQKWARAQALLDA